MRPSSLHTQKTQEQNMINQRFYFQNYGGHIQMSICQIAFMKSWKFAHEWHSLFKVVKHALNISSIQLYVFIYIMRCWKWGNALRMGTYGSQDVTFSIWLLNSLRLRRNRCHFADDIFKSIFLNENVLISIKFHWSLFPRVQLMIFQHWFR